MDKVILVAEIGINHNGDLDVAKQLIREAKACGCDYVKFQKRTVNKVYSEEYLSKYRESPWGETNKAQKLGLEFETTEYNIINNYCKEQEIKWFASPWDVDSVLFLNNYIPPFIKIASACITNFDLLYAIKMTGKPVIMSTGMSTKEEVKKAVDYLSNQIEYLLACTSTYPTKDEDMNLNFIKTLKKEFPKYKIGFSNHSAGIFFASVAPILGAEMIEFHTTLNRAMYGSDQAASIELVGQVRLIKYVRALEKALGTGEWIITDGEKEIRNKLRK
ncbi:MAG: N-acetylneuraminate synthase family protein [Candidatus Hodarchaeota archaeon]